MLQLSQNPSLRQLWILMCLAGVSSVAGAMAMIHWYGLGPVDDAFISLRYADNWASGHGLSFNPGERVEGYTNFLLVLLQAAAIRLGLDPVRAMTLIGLLSLGTLAGLSAGFARTFCTSRTWLAIAAGLLVGLHPSVLCWGTSGLESCLVALLLLAVVWSSLRPISAIWPWMTGLLLVLAGMARPESVVVLPAIVFAGSRQPGSRKPLVLMVTVFMLGFGGYFLSRAIFFQSLLPNTFYAKLDYGSLALAGRGLLYVGDFLLANPLLISLAIVAVLLKQGRSLPSIGVAGLVIVFHGLAVIYEGGDHFAMFRFMVPIIPFLVFLAVSGIETLVLYISARRWQLAGALAATLGLAAAGLVASQAGKRDEPVPISGFQRYLGECRLAANWEMMGRWFESSSPENATICSIAIGAIGYRSERTIIDPHGLIDPEIAHLNWNLGEGYLGHEKYDLQRVLARKPDYILAIHYPTKAAVPRENVQGAVWGPFSTSLLASPDLDLEYDYRSVDLGGWYMNFFQRRGAPGTSDRQDFKAGQQ